MLTRIDSPIGTLFLEANDRALLRVSFEAPPEKSLAESRLGKDTNPVLDLAIHELDLYFSGALQAFSVPLAAPGTDFQRRAWKALLEIPYGETRSYREQASRVGSPRAFRAVGTANSLNPFPILIPCHRVIRSDGSAGGYAGAYARGASIKSQLLELERRSLTSARSRSDGQNTTWRWP